MAKNLEDSIFTDERLGKRILSQFKRKGIRVLSMHFLVNGEGKYELHLTMRTWKSEKIPVKSLAGTLSNLTGRRLIPGKEGAQLIGTDYTTVVFREGRSEERIALGKFDKYKIELKNISAYFSNIN